MSKLFIEMFSFVVKEFCPRIGLSPDQLKERLKIYEASIAAIQVNPYFNFVQY
jgi:hypothetical protein